MNSRNVTFSRDELFRLVWSSPLSQLLHSVGVSDLAIAKACRRAKIPLPGKGYWQTSAGSRPRTPQLPMDEDLPDVVTFIPEAPLASVEFVDATAPSEPPIKVSPMLRSPHALLELMPKRLHPWRAAGCNLNMIVSEQSLRRASRIMDALIKTTEREGWKWSGEIGKPSVVTVDGVDMKVMVRELRVVKKVKNPPSSYYEFNRDLEWTGDICITIDEWGIRGTRKKWRDTTRHRLETTLRKVVVGIREAAAAVGKAREEREEERRKHAIAYRAQLVILREQERAQHRRDELQSVFRKWRRVDSLRRFLRSASERIEQLPEDRRMAAMDWLDWGRAEADAMDPLHGDWSSLLDGATADSEEFEYD